jgi:hypothetical protein
MKRPTVHQAHAICESVKARGVIVLAFSKDNVIGVSYGETKLECKQIGHTTDRIVEAIEAGELPVWATGTGQPQQRYSDDTGLCRGCQQLPGECDCDSGCTCGCYRPDQGPEAHDWPFEEEQ